MGVETLPQFYDLMRSTVPVRREAVEDVLAARPVSPAAVSHLRESLSALESIPEEEGGRRLRVEGTRTALLDLGYEIGELKKDVVFLTGGDAALHDDLSARHDGLDAEVAAVVAALSGTTFHSFVTDRDGTVNNYCGRYASSVQSAYNAVFLTRFGRTVARPLILTSAPLGDPGLVDLAVTPEGAFVYAGSKGREYLDASGQRRRFPIDAARQGRLDDLNRRLDGLLAESGNEVFALVGSGLQHKFGQTTVARQDIAGSIPEEDSARFRARVRDLVRGADPEGAFLRIEDTGLDLEILLTVDDGSEGPARDFDKGDGVRFLDQDLPLKLERGPCLVCGDTASDVPMLEAALDLAPSVHSVFVTRREELRARVRRVHPRALFVSEPDALVTALDDLGRQVGRE